MSPKFSRCVIVVLGLITVLLLAPIVATAEASVGCQNTNPNKTKLLFLSNRPGGKNDDNWDLYEANIAGGNVQRLTDIKDVSIRWFDKDPVRDRVVAAGSSRGNLAIGPSGNDGGPADAEEILAILNRDQEPQILLDLRPGGNNPKNFHSLWHPTFSPDGKQIVFSAALRGESNNLWLINDDGTNLHRILDEPQRTQNDPRFTADGKVVYVRHQKQGINQLFHLDLFDVWLIDPNNPVDNLRLSNEENIPGPALTETDPAVSPDCRHVVMVRTAEKLSLLSMLRPFSSNAVMRTDGEASDFHLLQHGLAPERTHGVPTWLDNDTLFSYIWHKDSRAWRIIRFEFSSADGEVTIVDLDSVSNSSDLLPLAY